MNAHFICAMLVATCLVGCSQSPQPGAPQTPSQAASTPDRSPPSGAATAISPDCEFCAVPATVKRCEVAKGVRTTLHWDVTAKGVDTVVVYVVNKKGADQHFGKGPGKGSKVTGPWLRPGIQFKIKDAGGTELGLVTIEGEDC